MMDKKSGLSGETLQAIYRGEESDPEALDSLYATYLSDEPRADPKHVAFSRYWFNRTRNGEPAHMEEIEELLRYYSGEDYDLSAHARNIIGELAVFDILSAEQCHYLLGSVKNGDWAYDQLRARCELLDHSADILTMVDNLIALNATWAVVEIVDRASVDELRSIHAKMMDKSVLNRYNRHVVREAIGEILRRK